MELSGGGREAPGRTLVMLSSSAGTREENFSFTLPKALQRVLGGALVLVVGSGVVSGKATSIWLAPVKSVRSLPLPGTGVELYKQMGKTGTCNGDGDNKGRGWFPLGQGVMWGTHIP